MWEAGSPFLQLLMEPQLVSEETATMFLFALGCNENTTTEIFEALIAKDIADALDSQCFKDASSIVERALLFKMCKNLSSSWGRGFAESFERVGSRDEALAPQPQPQLLYLLAASDAETETG